VKLSIPRPLNEELLNCDGDPELMWTVLGMGTKKFATAHDFSTENNKRPFETLKRNLDLSFLVGSSCASATFETLSDMICEYH